MMTIFLAPSQRLRVLAVERYSRLRQRVSIDILSALESPEESGKPFTLNVLHAERLDICFAESNVENLRVPVVPAGNAQSFCQRLGDDYSVLIGVASEGHNDRQSVKPEVREKPSVLLVRIEGWNVPHVFALIPAWNERSFCTGYACLSLLHVLAAHHEPRAVSVIRIRNESCSD